MFFETFTSLVRRQLLARKLNGNNGKYLYFAALHETIITSLRSAHTDIEVPDYSLYRRNSLADPTESTSYSEDSRKLFSHMVLGVSCTIGLYALKAEVIRDVMSMAASADVLALAKIEINLADIAEGTTLIIKWRGKPLFIRHRAKEDIRVSRLVPMSALRDPATDEERCPKPEWLVVLGICTHLGCVPVSDQGDYGPGGSYCPCHGSHFDGAGRARKGPAPTNLEIPVHKFEGETTLIVG